MPSRALPQQPSRPLPQPTAPNLATAQPISHFTTTNTTTSTQLPAVTVNPTQTYSSQPYVSSSAPQYNCGSASAATLQLWAQRNDFLDIYMVTAFYMGTGQRSQYFMSLWKVVTCAALQFYGIWTLMRDQWTVYQENGSCNGSGGSVAFIAFLFATYISLYCSEQIRTLNRYGMYGWGQSQPQFVNSMWVGVGLWTNLCSLFMSWLVSCIIIFTSGDLLEMVLNAVAVTFMLSLDDEIVGTSDYENIVKWDGSNHSQCRMWDALFSKIGDFLLKVHPLFSRRYMIKGTMFECCDFIIFPLLIILPFIVLFCYPYGDSLCLYEGLDSLCL